MKLFPQARRLVLGVAQKPRQRRVAPGLRLFWTTVFLLLTGCAHKQQLAINDAYASGQLARANAITTCSTSTDVAACMLGVAVAFGGGAGNSPPVVQSDLSAVLNSSVLGAVVGAVRDVQVAKSAERSQIAAVNANAATQQATTRAFADVAASGNAAIQNTAGTGLGAVRDTAGAAFSAMDSSNRAALGAVRDTATATADAGARSAEAAAAASAEWAQTVREAAPTYSYGENATVTTGEGNAVDQSNVGRDRDVTRNCTSTSTASATGSSSGSGYGTTGATGSGGAVGIYPTSPSANECGG